MTSFNLNYPSKGPVSKGSHIGGEGFHIWIWGDTSQSITQAFRTLQAVKLQVLRTHPLSVFHYDSVPHSLTGISWNHIPDQLFVCQSLCQDLILWQCKLRQSLFFYQVLTFKSTQCGTSLMAQWLRICLPAQWHGFDPWSGKIPHAMEQLSPLSTTTEPTLQSLQATTTELTHHNYWSPHALEPARCNYCAYVLQLLKPACSRACMPQLLSLNGATTEARTPRSRAPQQEKPPQREARTPQWRVAPACCN